MVRWVREGIKNIWRCQYLPLIYDGHSSLTSESRVLSVGLTKSVVVTCYNGGTLFAVDCGDHLHLRTEKQLDPEVVLA